MAGKRIKQIEATYGRWGEKRKEALNAIVEQIDANRTLDMELKQLGNQLGIIVNTMEKGNGEISSQISELTGHMEDDAIKSQEQRTDILQEATGQTEASNTLRTELQQLGSQLSAISDIIEKSNGKISTQIIELMVNTGADAIESRKLLGMLVKEQGVKEQDG